MLLRSKPLLGFLLFSMFFASTFAISSVSVSNGTTVYEILTDFGLPSGLLPDSVKDFSLSDDGSFVVDLEKPCYIQFDYLVYYDRRITGTLKYGSITHLNGIEVQRFLLWLNVDEIRVDLPPSDSIYFQVGWINKKLDVDQFQTVHSCRKGISCQGYWKDLLKIVGKLIANKKLDIDMMWCCKFCKLYYHILVMRAGKESREVSSCGSSRTRDSGVDIAERVNRRWLAVEVQRGDINELADAFIKNFHKQLKIQRDESFKCYEEMIARGT
ncbi:hypothetical protein HHK36_012058 [Tetracentron sinense]|uniref:Uncharacterized protein n=1 Tax=Tetracentron sinense TaxID=13715 RepID=A0A835DHV2_TETSI|nr:hypothetical protein HHK36_012058 [Tetracentron sinense]